MSKKIRLGVELLEGRDCPSISAAGGFLTLVGGNGGDKMIVDYQDAAHVQVEAIIYHNFGQLAQTKERVLLPASQVHDVIFLGGNGNDLIINKTDTFTTAFGGNGDDKIVVGGGLPDQFGHVPVSQGSLVFGGNGHDEIVGGSGDDHFDGGNGDDCLFGKAGNDILVGGNGNDYLYGSCGNDQLFGGNGADVLFGNCGNDFLDGGFGTDQIHTGTGNNLWLSSKLDTVFAQLNGKADVCYDTHNYPCPLCTV